MVRESEMVCRAATRRWQGGFIKEGDETEAATLQAVQLLVYVGVVNRDGDFNGIRS
jgi:hypothetical protein